MKRILSICVLAFAAITTLCAQDIIVTKDAQKIEAKILEVSKSEIKYKDKDNLNGPTFILETAEISSIIYANGKVVLYNQQTTAKEPDNSEEKAQVVAQPEEKKEQTIPKYSVDESTAEILLRTGETITVQITELKSDYVAYILNGKAYTTPATQIEKVTFVHNGQVKDYSRIRETIIAKQQREIATTNNDGSRNGRIYRDNGHYLYNDIYISSKEVERILEKENDAAYKQWQKANGMLVGGSICAGIGGGLVIGGLVTLITRDYIPCLIMECCALVPLGVGLGLTLGASAQYNKAIDIYNSKYDHAAVQLKWHIAPTEVGLALAF